MRNEFKVIWENGLTYGERVGFSEAQAPRKKFSYNMGET